MFVAVEADAVAETVGEEFVAGAVACGGHDGASGIVDCAGEASDASGVESGILGFAQSVEYVDEFVGWLFGEDDRAGHVGLVALDLSAAVDQDNVSGLQ